MTNKTKENYFLTMFELKCKGRDLGRNEVLEEAVDVKVKIIKTSDRYISLDVECPYYKGNRAKGCSASHSNEKDVEGVKCVYSITLPYEIDLYEKLTNSCSLFDNGKGGLEKKI